MKETKLEFTATYGEPETKVHGTATVKSKKCKCCWKAWLVAIFIAITILIAILTAISFFALCSSPQTLVSCHRHCHSHSVGFSWVAIAAMGCFTLIIICFAICVTALSLRKKSSEEKSPNKETMNVLTAAYHDIFKKDATRVEEESSEELLPEGVDESYEKITVYYKRG